MATVVPWSFGVTGRTAVFVLIVGNNLGARAALESAVADFGLDWQIELADNDAAALAIAAQRTVDVAVVDLRAPGVNGPALLAAIRQRYPEVVRLLLIDDAQQDDAMRVLDSAHRFLNQPLRADELIEAVESVGRSEEHTSELQSLM